MPEKCTKEQFLKRVKDHKLTVLHEDGLYRHLYCNNPEWGGIESFNIITYPGGLLYTGDMGSYAFERTDDMFTFFRHADGGINPQYWSEKVVCQDRDGVEDFSIDDFKNRCIGLATDLEWHGNAILDLTNELDGVNNIDDATRLIENFEYLMPDEDYSLRDNDFYAGECTEYSFRFIFACYAIVWAINKYDELQEQILISCGSAAVGDDYETA